MGLKAPSGSFRGQRPRIGGGNSGLTTASTPALKAPVAAIKTATVPKEETKTNQETTPPSKAEASRLSKISNKFS